MESINPCLELLLVVRRSIEKGQTVRQGVQNYLQQSQSPFRFQVLNWQRLIESGQNTNLFIASIESIQRRNLLMLLGRGVRGDSIYQNLLNIENEIIDACHDDLARKMAKLPIVMLVPLLFFIFPAFLMLLFGPLLQTFLTQLGGG